MTLPQHYGPIGIEEREGLRQTWKDIIMNGFLILLTYEDFLGIKQLVLAIKECRIYCSLQCSSCLYYSDSSVLLL